VTEDRKVLWTQDYGVSSFLLDSTEKLSLYGLLNLLQDTAWLHIHHLGHGYAQRREQQSVWILAQQTVRMQEWPRWGESLQIRTWLRHPAQATAVRDFELWSGLRQIGEASARYVTMDERTRRLVPVNVPPELLLRRTGTLNPEKVPLQTGATALATFRIRNSDLDFHGHVNNTRYALWILDSLPQEVIQQHEVVAYQVSFLAEVRARQEIEIQSRRLSAHCLYFQGWRAADQTVVFTARLEAGAG
jgi:acyl-ACP thioesterase